MIVTENEENDLKFEKYMKRINQFEKEYGLKIRKIFKDKELFLKRTQDTNLPISKVLNKKDKLLVVNLEKIIDNQDELADLLKLDKNLI